MEYRLNTKKPPLFYLILLISFPSAAAVLLSPALPAISSYFQISAGLAQQLITVFVIGYAFGQLMYSPFANRFGRKIAISLGISLYMLSCVICLLGIYHHSIEILFLGRFLMALGSSVGMIVSFTIINDFYYPQESRSVTSYTVLAYAFVPAIATALGGAITTNISWIGCFYFYLVYGLCIWGFLPLMPETLQEKDLNALKLPSLIRGYSKAFCSKRLIVFAVMYGLMAAYIYIIASGGPFIGIKRIGWTPALYGYLLLIPYTGQLLGALLSGYANKHLSAYAVMTMGFCLAAFGTVSMLICFLFGWINFFSFLIPIFFIMMGLPKFYSNSVVMGLQGFGDKSTGSAIFSFIAMFTILIFNFTYGIFPNKYCLMMPLAFLFIIILVYGVFHYVRSRYSDKNLPNI